MKILDYLILNWFKETASDWPISFIDQSIDHDATGGQSCNLWQELKSSSSIKSMQVHSKNKKWIDENKILKLPLIQCNNESLFWLKWLFLKILWLWKQSWDNQFTGNIQNESLKIQFWKMIDFNISKVYFCYIQKQIAIIGCSKILFHRHLRK